MAVLGTLDLERWGMGLLTWASCNDKANGETFATFSFPGDAFGRRKDDPTTNQN
jgi:hypothetical protein